MSIWAFSSNSPVITRQLNFHYVIIRGMGRSVGPGLVEGNTVACARLLFDGVALMTCLDVGEVRRGGPSQTIVTIGLRVVHVFLVNVCYSSGVRL
jgi:hypothetical protein